MTSPLTLSHLGNVITGAPHVRCAQELAGPRAGALTTAWRLVREWRRRHRERRELAAYICNHRHDLGYAATLDAEIAKPFWRA